jgi:MFS family permease
MVARLIETYRAAFRGLSREVWILAGLALVNRSGTMVLAFLALYLTTQHGYTVSEAGVLVAVYGIGGMLGIELGGRLADRVGHRQVMGASLVATGLWMFVFGTLESRAALGAGAALLGLLTEAFRPASSVALAVASRPESRVRAFGLQRLAVNAGMTVGPLVGGALAVVDYGWLFVVDGSTCLAAAALLFAAVPRRPSDAAGVEHEAGTASPNARGSPWRDRDFAWALVFLSMQAVVFFQVLSTFPVFLREERGLSEAAIGAVLAVNTVVIVLFEMVLVHSIARRRPLSVVGLAGVFVGVGFGALPLATSLPAIVLTVVLWTIGEMLGAPVMQAWVANRAGTANRGRYMAAFALCFSLSSVVAPLAGTWIYEELGPRTLWTACLTLGLVQWFGFRFIR